VTNGATPHLPTATGFAARRAVVALRNRDIDPTPFLERFGLSEPDVNTDLIRVSAAAQARFLEFVAEKLQDPALGFHIGMEVNPRQVGLLFYVASAGKDLGEAIALFARYCRIVNEAVRVKLTPVGDELVTEVSLVGVPRFRAVQNSEFGITVMVKSLREITGRNIRPTRIIFAHIRNSDFPEFERFCGCPVEFGGPCDQIVFSNQSLTAPLITGDVHLLDTLRPICDEAAKQRETVAGSLRAAVENEAQKLLPHGHARRHLIAKKLAMSTRTLARRLAQENTTFEGVIDELRRSLALQYIKTPGISLSQMAWLLGYEGSTSFNHAFRRWTGAPPSAARGARQLPPPAWSVASTKSHAAGS
jgi:AraC-like DNA-binding protein